MFDISEAFADIFPRRAAVIAGKDRLVRMAPEIAHIHEGFAALGVPCYPTPERAIFAFSRMVEYARFRGVIGK